jgi:5S rRNA maturation endonuclease (ribonuclease M5)
LGECDGELKRSLERLIGQLRQGIVVVEGKHDVDALRELGVTAFNCNSIEKINGYADGSTFYMLFDADKGGDEKFAKAASIVYERYPHSRINTYARKRLFGILGIKCVEEAVSPAKEILEIGNKIKVKSKK